MIEERAVVVANDGDQVWVETQRQSTCGTCSVNKGCGTAVLTGVLGARRTRIRARNALVNLQPGETVVVGMQDSALVNSAAAFFGVPIASMFVSAIAGGWLLSQFGLPGGEGLNIVLGFGGLALGVIWVRIWAEKKRPEGDYELRILRRWRPTNAVVTMTRKDN